MKSSVSVCPLYRAPSASEVQRVSRLLKTPQETSSPPAAVCAPGDASGGGKRVPPALSLCSARARARACVCVCVCERERERERERSEAGDDHTNVCVCERQRECVCVCVCGFMWFMRTQICLLTWVVQRYFN